MPRQAADRLPEPGDDSAIAQHIEAARRDPDFRPAPQPQPMEQPDPPKGTPPADQGPSDAELRKMEFHAATDVGQFTAGTLIPKDHFGPHKLRRLMAEGKVKPTSEGEPAQ